MNFDRILGAMQRVILGILIFMTPLTYWPINSWLALPVYDLSFGLLVICFLLHLLYPKIAVPRFRIRDLVLLLFLVWLAFNGFTNGSYAATVPLLEMSVLLFIVSQSQFTEGQLFALAVIQVLAGVVVALIGIYQHWFAPWMSGFAATFGNQNLFSGYLSLLLPISFSFWLSGKRRVRFGGVLATTVLAYAMTLTFTRAGWLAALGSLTGLALTKNRKLMIVVVVYVLIFGFGVKGAAARFEQVSEVADIVHISGPKAATVVNSVNSRVNLWRFALAEFAKSPLRGIGIGNYRSYLAQYVKAHPQEAKSFFYGVEDVHNSYLKILVELGLPGFVLFLLLLAIWVGPVGVKLFTEARVISPLQAGIWWGLAAFLLHSLTNNLFFTVPTAYGFWVGLGILTVLNTPLNRGGVHYELHRFAQ